MGYTAPAEKIVNTIYANYRNSIIQKVSDRVPLQIDGLLGSSFNKMPWDVWNPALSKIIPRKVDELYFARINCKTTSINSAVITIELDVDGAILSHLRFQPLELNNAFNSGLMMFYARENLVARGGILYVSATSPVELTETSLLLTRLATTEV